MSPKRSSCATGGDEIRVCEFRRTNKCVCVCVENTGESCELIAFASAAKIHQRSDTEIQLNTESGSQSAVLWRSTQLLR